MKEQFLLYKLYLQTLLNVQEHQNKYGDEDMLAILEDKLSDDIKVKKMTHHKNKKNNF